MGYQKPVVFLSHHLDEVKIVRTRLVGLGSALSYLQSHMKLVTHTEKC